MPALDWQGVLTGQPLQWILSGFLTTLWVTLAGIVLASLLALLFMLLRLSGGRMREVLNILANIERIAATNGLAASGADPLDVPQFAGVALTHDWQSRTAKTVKAR